MQEGADGDCLLTSSLSTKTSKSEVDDISSGKSQMQTNI